MVRVESSRTPSPTPTHGRGTGTTCDESFGNKAGGTLAFAQDLNDPNLTKWVKDGPLSRAVWAEGRIVGGVAGGGGRWLTKRSMECSDAGQWIAGSGDTRPPIQI